jgi:hypothetical protein
MKTVLEVLEEMGPRIEVLWDVHSEIKDGAARAGVAVAEAMNALDIGTELQLKVVDAIMKRPAFPNYREGLLQWFKDTLDANR